MIGFSSRQERAGAERATFARHDSEFWGLLHLGDAIHQFYRDTLDLIGKSLTPGMADVQVAMVNWHLVSFSRVAAAYHLAAHGYYFDAMALARDLWEVGLSLAALKRNVVTVDELLVSGATTMKDAERMSREIDARIRRALTGKTQRSAVSHGRRSTRFSTSRIPRRTSPSSPCVATC